MKKIKYTSLVLISLTLVTPFSSRAIDNKQLGTGTVIVGSCAVLFGLYKWYFAEMSNTELCKHGKRLYEKLHNKHTSNALIYRSLSSEMSEEQLYELVNHPDIQRLKGISKDFPQLNRTIGLIADRMKKESDEGRIADRVLQKQYEELTSLGAILKRGADFWKRNVSFYELHSILRKISPTYSPIRGGLVSSLFDYYIERDKQALDKLETQLKQDIRLLQDKSATCNNYVMLLSSTQSLIRELQLIQESVAALKAFLALEQEFQRYDDFAKKLSFRDHQELPAKVKGIYAGTQDHPFEFVATEANKALSLLEKYQNAVTNCSILFNQEDPFAGRVYKLLEHVEELGSFLVALREQVVSLPEYDDDLKVKRKDKKRAQEVALEQERIRKENERERKKEQLEREKINAEREKAIREQQAKKYEADQKVEEARLLNEAKQKEKEIEALKMQQEKERLATANGSIAT